jgi:hypothetical protein
MDLSRLQDIVATGEQERVEFKGSVAFKEGFRPHLAAVIAAMANTLGGGIVVLGVDKHGDVKGLSDSEVESYDPTAVGNYLSSRLSEMPVFRIIRARLNDVRVAVIEVDESDRFPIVVTRTLESDTKRWALSGDVLVRTTTAETRRADGESLKKLFARVEARASATREALESRQPTSRVGAPLVIDLPSPRHALAIAQATVGGKVLFAHPYADGRTSRLFIAGYRAFNGNRAFVLEPVAELFQVIWESSPLPYDVQNVVVEDIDHDGLVEFCFYASGWGNGSGGALLLTYSPRAAQACTLSEEHSWQDRTLPLHPRIGFSPEPDSALRVGMERLAHDRFGMLRSTMPEPDSPEAASMWWHADNGNPQSGPLTFRRYKGFPSDGSTREEYEFLGTRWLSFYKGALIAYSEDRNEHYIAYSPSWSYNWITTVLQAGGIIWFGQHLLEGIKALHVAGDRGYVQHISSVRGRPLPEVESLSTKPGLVVLNEGISLSLVDLFSCLDRNLYGEWPSTYWARVSN